MKKKITKHMFKSMASLLLGMSVCWVARADYLPNNFWPNPGFELGTNLNQTNGVPTGWNADGGDPTMCQVTTNNSISPTHALCVIDSTFDYCAWDSNLLPLAGLANPGDSINLQWYQLFSISSGEMRVTVSFFDVNTNHINDTHAVVNGDSAGWGGTIASSTFTKFNETIIVPVGAVLMTVSLVSGGSGATVGTMVIDDLSVALQPVPYLLPGNFWPNPSFELGSNLNQTNGVPTGWNFFNSGSSIICQVTTNNYVSAGHALAQIDNDTGNYGSWYSDHAALTNTAIAGSTLNIQWFELYSITNGEMRMVFTFFNAGGGSVGAGDINYTVNGNSSGWQGAVAGSGFTKRDIALIVPAGAVTIGVQLVSGGPGATTGIMMIDDLSMATPPAPPILAGNFWPNSGFESGSNLNQTNGVPTGWVANGNDTGICQVTTNAYSSPTHALALIDNDTPTGYGEWDGDLYLGANAGPGDTITVQWSELYAITNGPMRVTVLFLDVNTNVLTATDNNSSGNSSGWAGQIVGSTFTLRNLQVMIPHNAVFLRIALVSGGPQTATGVYVIDDLSVAKAAYPATVLSYDFFPNPTFESGVSLDNPTVGLPAGGWQRGGSSAAIDQVLTNNSVSPRHALALVDNDTGNYGEWYMFLPTTSFIGDNDAVDVQWFQLYSVTNGSMRLSFAFLDSGNNALWSQDFNTGTSTNSPGWTGSVSTSPFQQMNQRFAVPVGTTQLRVNFASGGASTVNGVMVIDDLSMRLSLPAITGFTSQGVTNTVVWNSMSSKQYAVLYSGALGSGAAWSAVVTNLPGAGLTTTNLDITVHPGGKGFYRVEQE
ncbi:MAG TPA: hypothetical protein VNN22_02290 [Verrucomicrobiae bacterium]|nr:hypothetical protein [Verrucomicrobiae bacterium]